ncbi:MAG TPA: rhodanese-like domain-containing protein [Phycisphaerales bacterium]|nr:rhodanese-like domain-containing protein [Phycisphaerales bacterium]
MSYKEVDPVQAQSLMKEKDNLLLLDVREQFEYDKAHIEGVKLLPLGELPDRLSELDKEQPVLCICAGGVRSEKAARFLLSHDFQDVTNMQEGMKGWLARGLPASP